MIVGELIARNIVYMHHNNNVGLTIAIQFGGARPTDLNLGGGGGGAIAPPAPPVPPPLIAHLCEHLCCHIANELTIN